MKVAQSAAMTRTSTFPLLLLSVMLAAPAGLLHCSSDDGAEATNTPTHGGDAAAPEDAAPGPGPGPVATDGGKEAATPTSWPAVTATAAGTCGVDKLCVDVTLPAQTADYQIMVAWAQLDDDGPDPVPELAYLARVPAALRHFEIPVKDVKPPTDEKNLLCQRATDDESVSPCMSDPKVGYGFIVAVRDDGDGVLDVFAARDQRKDSAIGAVMAIFGHSDKAYPPGTAPTNTAFWDRLWPKGIEQGLRIYQIEDRADGGVFDRPIPSGPGITNKLGTEPPNLT